MSYEKINWQNSPSTDTPISAENLNKMDEAIFEAHEQLDALPEWSKNKEKPKYTAEEVGTYTKAELEAYKANSILSKASGEVVTTTDSAKVKPKNIKLFGKGKQRQYEGNQLFDAKTAFATQIEAGIITVNDDGSVTLNGEFNATNRSFSITLQAGTYYFTESKNILHHFAKGSDVCWNNSAVLEEETTFSGYINSDTYNNVTISPIIATSSDVELEPYVGNEPSPSINYPQEAEFLGESGSIGGKVLKKNFLPNNATSKTENGVSFTVNADKSITIKGTTSAETYLYLVPTTNTKTLQKGKYVISGGKDNVFITMYKPNWTQIVVSKNNEEADIELLEDTEYFCYITVRANYTYDTTIYPMVRPYGMDNTYEVHSDTEQPFTFQTPNGLRGIPLGTTIPDAIKNSPIHMSGVYWDSEDNQYYIGDTENEDGKDVQRCCKQIVTKAYGIEIINDVTIKVTGLLPDATRKAMNVLNAFCDKSRHGFHNSDTEHFYMFNNSDLFPIWINRSRLESEDLDGVNAFLSSNPLEVTYVLADPIITDTTDQLDVVMNYPNTTIVNDAGAYMEVEYVCDTKEHIKQNYVSKEAYNEHESRIAELEKAIVNS